MPITEKERNAKVQEKYQAVLMQMLRDDDNKYCVDCDAKGPRWASWNLGIFLCIRCAGIHRNLGVHISKVKSVNLDQWTAEQIASVQAMGNSKGRAVYEANLPDNYRRPQTDSALEQFIRGKYEQRKWIAKEWIPPNITISPDLTDEEPVKEKSKKPESKPKETVKLTPKKADNEKQVKKEDIKQPAKETQAPAAAPPPNLLDFDDIPQSGSATSNDSNNSFGPFIGITSPVTTTVPATTTTTSPSNQATNDLVKELGGVGIQPQSVQQPLSQQQQQQAPTPSSNVDLVSELNQKKAPLDKKDILALFNVPPPATAAAAQPQMNMLNTQFPYQQQQQHANGQYPAPGLYPQLNPQQQQQAGHFQMPQFYGINPQQTQQMPPQLYNNQPQFAPMMQYNNQQSQNLQLNNLQMQMTNLNINHPQTTAAQQQPAFAWPNQMQQQHTLQPQTTTSLTNLQTQNLFNFNLPTTTTNTTNSNQTTLSSNLWQ